MVVDFDSRRIAGLTQGPARRPREGRTIPSEFMKEMADQDTKDRRESGKNPRDLRRPSRRGTFSWKLRKNPRDSRVCTEGEEVPGEGGSVDSR